jgi:hypothetical protein
MPDTRLTPSSDRYHASRVRRREAALVAEYIHELSDRHNGSGESGEPAVERRPRGDRAPGEEGG